MRPTTDITNISFCVFDRTLQCKNIRFRRSYHPFRCQGTVNGREHLWLELGHTEGHVDEAEYALRVIASCCRQQLAHEVPDRAQSSALIRPQQYVAQ